MQSRKDKSKEPAQIPHFKLAPADMVEYARYVSECIGNVDLDNLTDRRKWEIYNEWQRTYEENGTPVDFI